MTGDIDLTTVRFPTESMTNESALQGLAAHFSTAPFYLAKAAMPGIDPLERLKMVICMDVSSIIYNVSFENPQIPNLNDTFTARGQDGSKMSFKQVSDCPPQCQIEVAHKNYSITGDL